MKFFSVSSANLRFLFGVAFIAATLAATTSLHAQTVVYAGTAPSLDFGSVNVCPSGATAPAPCSKTLTLTYKVTYPGTLLTPEILTVGSPNLDYTLAPGSTCIGPVERNTTCTVNVKFTPRYPGERMGGVLMTRSTGTIIATTPIYGTGIGPQVGFVPGNWKVFSNSDFGVYGIDGIYAANGAGDVFGFNGDGDLVKIPAGRSDQKFVTRNLPYPAGIAIDGSGNLFVPELLNGTIVEIKAGKTSPITLPFVGLSYAVSVAVDAKGDVFTVSNNQVLELPADGGPQINIDIGVPNGGGQIAIDPAGDIFLTNSLQVVKLPAGGGAPIVITKGIGVIYTMAADYAGNLFLADVSMKRISEIPAGSTSVVKIQGWSSAPYVAVDPAGNIYVSGHFANGTPFASKLDRSAGPSLLFPATAVGQTSTPQSVLVQNIGNAPLTGSLSLGETTYFNQVFGTSTVPDCTTNISLAADTECNLGLTFTPSSLSGVNESIAVSDNSLNATPAKQTIGLIGNQPYAQLSVDSLLTYNGNANYTANFGVVTYPATSTKSITVTNTGSGILTLSPSINHKNYYLVGNTCGSGLAAGASCVLQVEFNPYKPGLWEGVLLTIANNGPSTPRVTLIGESRANDQASQANIVP
jgi:large repetitive protein